MKLVVSYVRLSEKDRDIKGLYSESINQQRNLIKDFAKNKGLVINKEYIDDGCSGGNFERPAFNELLMMLTETDYLKVSNSEYSKNSNTIKNMVYKISN